MWLKLVSCGVSLFCLIYISYYFIYYIHKNMHIYLSALISELSEGDACIRDAISALHI